MDKDLKSTSTGDASPLTTSTESEIFDTWTVITDKTKDEIERTPFTPDKSDDDEEIATDAVHVDVLKVSDDVNENRYNEIDDLSDGISIISESESAGRITPHPELRAHLSDLHMRFLNVSEPLQPSIKDSTSPLNYEACSERSTDSFHRVEPLVESHRKSRRVSRQLAESRTDFQPTLRCGLRGLFYVGALLAVLAFISKLKYDSWESVIGTTTGLLSEKVNELELKNNLMRAEIDILTKQVKYLTTLSENQKYASPPSTKPKSKQPRENKIKVYPGNGNIINEVEIYPKDLKKPFKCEGHNNVDIAGMCIELPLSTESVVDSLGEKVRTVIGEKQFLSKYEKVVEKLGNVIDNPFENPSDTTTQQLRTDYMPHEHKPDQYDSKKHEKHRDSHKKHSGESKERERYRNKSNEDGSGERYKKSKDHKKYEKRSSSMEYENAKREADGEWHEKLMQHRENIRKTNEKHRHDKNWYIERGDSREQARMTEQRYRGQ